jgi:hypothetical protein
MSVYSLCLAMLFTTNDGALRASNAPVTNASSIADEVRRVFPFLHPMMEWLKNQIFYKWKNNQEPSLTIS